VCTGNRICFGKWMAKFRLMSEHLFFWMAVQ
jgi:hypothetical protein